MYENLDNILINEKNEIVSRFPFVFIAELSLDNFPQDPPFRYANNTEPVTFHADVYQKSSFSLTVIRSLSTDFISQLDVGLVGVTREVNSLFERRWASNEQVYPLFTFRLWLVWGQDPNLVAREDALIFDVKGCATTYPTATIRVASRQISTTDPFPERRYTRSGGFPEILSRYLS